jgi:hypothetical protein
VTTISPSPVLQETEKESKAAPSSAASSKRKRHWARRR